MKRKRAFTLAETLITLAIIGVVAAITLPTLFSSITEMVNSNREANIAQKFSQAMDHMGALGLLDQGFSSTDEFVDELEKYIKVAKRCDSSHLDECWPTRYVTDSLGKTYDIKNAKTGNELKIFNNDTDNVGLVLTDGSSVILTYNEKYPGFDSGKSITKSKKSLPVGFGRMREFVYSSSSTAPIDFIMDVNGAKGPNSETVNGKFHDIRSFRRASLGECTVKIKGFGCIVDLGTDYEPYGTVTYTGVYAPHTGRPDYWAGAQKTCQDMKMTMPTLAVLKDLNINYRDKYIFTGYYWTSQDDKKTNFGCYRNMGLWANEGYLGKCTDSCKDHQHKIMCIGN